MPELGRAAACPLPRSGALRAHRRRVCGCHTAQAPGAGGAERAPRRVRRGGGRFGRPARGAPAQRLLVRLRRRAHEPPAADAVHDLRLLGRAGGLAPPLAARPDGVLGRGGRIRPPNGPGPPRVGRPGARPRDDVLRLHARRGLEPVRDPGRSRRRRRPQPEPPEPVHDDPPALPLPRLRRAHDPVRLRDGRAPRAKDRRALDRRHAPLDALRLDGARHRPAPRRPLGVRRGRLGWLLRLGPGRERGADAVARRDRLPALGDDPGEARHAEGLEHAARHPRLLPRALRDLPDAAPG